MNLSQNLEVKVRVDDLQAIRREVIKLPPRDTKRLHQIDTYFRCETGRLKLREINDTRGELIWYDRPDEAEAKVSRYHIVHVDNPHALKLALDAALGTRGVVRKRREVHLWHNVRIHLDEVDDLGDYVEFEAVLGEGGDAEVSASRLSELTRRLALAGEEHVAVGYADLLGLR